MTLVNAIRFDGYIVRILGIGYLFRLSESIKSVVPIRSRNDVKHNRNLYWWVISTFTNMNVWDFFDRLYGGTLKEVLDNIVRYNIPTRGTHSSEIDNDYIGIIVDELAAAYGYEKDYILEKLTLDDVLSLRAARLKREANEIRRNVAVAHNPKGAIDYAEHMTGIKRFGSLGEALRYAKEHCDG